MLFGRGPAALAAHQDAQRIAHELPRLAKAVVQEPDVMLLDRIGVIAEYRDGRRQHTHLRRVVELHLTTRHLRRLPPREQFTESLVHLRRGDALVAFVVDELDEVEHLGHALTSERGGEEKGHPREEWRLLARLLLELRDRLVVL